MTTPSTVHLPKPRSADEFENLATDAMGKRLRAPATKRHGRNGQRQFGVDATSSPAHLGGGIIGLQYKNVATLTREDIEAEVAKADAFVPPIAEYWIVTTLDRDAALDRDVLALSRAREAAQRFPVRIWFWQDLCGDLDAELVTKHYNWLGPAPAASAVVEHRLVRLPAGAPAVVPPAAVDWDRFYAIHDDRGPRASAYLKLVATPKVPLQLVVDGDLLHALGEQVQRVFGQEPGTPPWRARADGAELLWRHPLKAVSRHWMRGQDGSLGFATTIESPARPGHVSLWESALEVLRFFQLVRVALGDRDVDVELDYEPHDLKPTPMPCAPADDGKPGLAGVTVGLAPASLETTYRPLTKEFLAAELARPFAKVAGMLVDRWRVMFDLPALRAAPLAQHLEQLATRELAWPPHRVAVHVSFGLSTAADNRALYDRGLDDGQTQVDPALGERMVEAIGAALVRAGFDVVARRDQPHDVGVLVNVHQAVRVDKHGTLMTTTSHSVVAATSLTITRAELPTLVVRTEGRRDDPAVDYASATAHDLVAQLAAAGVRPDASRAT